MTEEELKQEAENKLEEWTAPNMGCCEGYCYSEVADFMFRFSEPREKRIEELEAKIDELKSNSGYVAYIERGHRIHELEAQIEKMKVQHFTDIRLYTKVIGIAVEESIMNDKQNYKNYLFDKAKKILSMGVNK